MGVRGDKHANPALYSPRDRVNEQRSRLPLERRTVQESSAQVRPATVSHPAHALVGKGRIAVEGISQPKECC